MRGRPWRPRACTSRSSPATLAAATSFARRLPDCRHEPAPGISGRRRTASPGGDLPCGPQPVRARLRACQRRRHQRARLPDHAHRRLPGHARARAPGPARCPGPATVWRSRQQETAPDLWRPLVNHANHANHVNHADHADHGRTPMPRFAANLSMLYNEVEFLHRFAAAAGDGFKAVEYIFPYGHPAQELAARLRAHGLQQVLFNAPAGRWDAGERGLACLPGRQAEFRAALEQALAYAQVLECPRIHVMAGLVPQGVDAATVRATYVANLRHAAKQAAPQGIDILLEPINGRDMPGFFLSRQDQAHALVAEIGAANVKVQMDLYHAQIVEGDLATKLRQYLPTAPIPHIHIPRLPHHPTPPPPPPARPRRHTRDGGRKKQPPPPFPQPAPQRGLRRLDRLRIP